MKTKKLIFIFFLIFQVSIGKSQPFIESEFNGFPDLKGGSSISVGDYNNDGLLDIALTGYNGTSIIAQIYENLGNGNFIKSADLYGLNSGDIEWADFNGDNYLDIINIGRDWINSGNEKSIIYLNNTKGQFLEKGPNGITGMDSGSLNIADIDNDGDLDIIITGITQGTAVTDIYLNNGDGTFIKKNNSIEGSLGHSDISDYDNDGDFDLIQNMLEPNLAVSKVYNNDGKGNFNENTEIKLDTIPTYGDMYVKWIDYDNDADMDINISGIDDVDKKIIELLYENKGNGNFAKPFSIQTNKIGGSEPAWGDYDNDGLNDLFIAGIDSTRFVNLSNPPKTVLYRKFENDKYEAIKIDLPSSKQNKCGDFDNDLDLDIIRTSGGDSLNISHFTRICLNQTTNINTKPNAPDTLNVSMINNTITLSWNKGNDIQTPQSGLTYNLFLYNNSSNYFSLSPMADTASGFRRIVKVGNATVDTTWSFNNIPYGDYTCGVQTIDGSYVGSNFIKNEFIWGIVGDSNICSGVISQYHSTPNSTSYLWGIEGGSIIGRIDTNIIIVKWEIPGSHSINLISDVGSFSLNVQITDNSKPIVSIENDSLTTNRGSIFQWYCNGIPVKDSIGGTNKTLKPQSLGYYCVNVYNGEGCYSYSDSILIDTLPSNIFSYNKDNQISIFPNPANNYITIQSSHLLEQPEILIYDCFGREVSFIKKQDLGSSIEFNLDVSFLQQGIYFLLLKSQTYYGIGKIIIK